MYFDGKNNGNCKSKVHWLDKLAVILNMVGQGKKLDIFR